MARALALPTWPDGAEVAVSLTFDVDAESLYLGASSDYERRLTSLSTGRFGIVRGLPRILDLLAAYSIPATFYVPGFTVDRYPEEIAAIAAAGHEVGHHGYLHLRSDLVDEATQRQEIERGLETLESRLGITPSGYRSPAWELTPETFRLLAEFGFAYDSSCMGDDRPYVEELDELAILELPVHWSLDDWPYFAWSGDGGGSLADPDTFGRIWRNEFESAVADRRHVTFTMHPEVIGRGYRMAALERLIEEMKASTDVWFARHEAVAALVAAGHP